MQAYDADFYPVKEKEKSSGFFKIFGTAMCLILVLLLVLRIYGWNQSRQETRLLVLINEWNSIERSEFSPRLKEAEGGFRLDKQCIKDFRRMMSDCRGAGLEPKLISAYRDEAEQAKIFSAQERKLEAQGKNKEAALTETARPGRSEHQLGLAVDIIDESFEGLEEKQDESPVICWLKENSWRYGFILRYPQEREDSTGISYKPWHYRYVGHKAAKQIYEMGICLEDYIEMFYSEEAVIKFED